MNAKSTFGAHLDTPAPSSNWVRINDACPGEIALSFQQHLFKHSHGGRVFIFVADESRIFQTQFMVDSLGDILLIKQLHDGSWCCKDLVANARIRSLHLDLIADGIYEPAENCIKIHGSEYFFSWYDMCSDINDHGSYTCKDNRQAPDSATYRDIHDIKMFPVLIK